MLRHKVNKYSNNYYIAGEQKMENKKTKNLGYYTSEEVAEGIDGLLPIKEVTLRNLRQKRKIRYTKLGVDCVYKKEWIQEYLDKNEVAPIVA